MSEKINFHSTIDKSIPREHNLHMTSMDELDRRIAKFKKQLTADGILMKDWAKWDAEHEGQENPKSQIDRLVDRTKDVPDRYGPAGQAYGRAVGMVNGHYVEVNNYRYDTVNGSNHQITVDKNHEFTSSEAAAQHIAGES